MILIGRRRSYLSNVYIYGNETVVYLFYKKTKIFSTMVARTTREILRWIESLYLTYPIIVPKWYVSFFSKHFKFFLEKEMHHLTLS